MQLEGGVEYYVWDGIDYEIKAHTFESVIIMNYGKGICGIINLGFNKPLIGDFMWSIRLSAKYSISIEEGYSSLELIEQLTSVTFPLTGCYIDFGIRYIFKKNHNGGVR